MPTSLNWAPTTITKVKEVKLKHNNHKCVVYSSQAGPSRQIQVLEANFGASCPKEKTYMLYYNCQSSHDCLPRWHHFHVRENTFVRETILLVWWTQWQTSQRSFLLIKYTSFDHLSTTIQPRDIHCSKKNSSWKLKLTSQWGLPNILVCYVFFEGSSQ